MRGARRGARGRRSEGGYALLGLMAILTLALVFMAAAQPALKHETQREREEEMFWRGQQVANGILRYAAARGGQFPASYPTKLDDLAELVQLQGKRLRFVRPSALRDPLMRDGEWRAVRVGDPVIREFFEAYTSAAPRKQPPLPPPPELLVRLATTQSGAKFTENQMNQEKENEDASGLSSELKSETGPIVGVVSRSKEDMIRDFLGIQSYSGGLFFAGVRTQIAGLPLVMLPPSQAAPTGPKDNRCPGGGIWFEPPQVPKAGCYGNFDPAKR